MTETTNEQLYRWHIEIQQLASTSAIGFLLKGRINAFYKECGLRITTLVDKLKAIQADFLVLDAAGLPVFKHEGDQRIAQMLEGKTIEEFNKLTKDLMDKKIAINI